MKQASLGLVIIAGEDLARCLTAADGVVDEIVVVGKVPSDIFEVKEVSVEGDLDAKRNGGVAACGTDWCLLLDSNQLVFKDELRKLKRFLNEAAADAYLLETRNYTNSTNIDGWKAEPVEGYQGYVPTQMIRLFKNDGEVIFASGHVDASVQKLGKKVQFIDDIPVRQYGGDALIAGSGIAGDYAQAVNLMQKGDYATSMNMFAKIAKEHPEYHFVQRNLGTLYMKGGDFDKALEKLQLAIEQRPSDAAAYNNLGVLFKKKQAWDRAVYCFSKAAELLPQDPRPVRALALVYKASGESTKGKELLEKGLKAFPESALLQEALDKY